MRNSQWFLWIVEGETSYVLTESTEKDTVAIWIVVTHMSTNTSQ